MCRGLQRRRTLHLHAAVGPIVAHHREHRLGPLLQPLRHQPAHGWVDDEHHADQLREILRAAAAALRAALALGRFLAEVWVREPERLLVPTREQPRALEEAARLEREKRAVRIARGGIARRIARVYREVVVESGPAAHAADEEEQAAARREEPAREEEDAAEGAVQRR